MKYPVTKAQADRILELRAQGMGIINISKQFNNLPSHVAKSVIDGTRVNYSDQLCTLELQRLINKMPVLGR